MDDQLRLDRHLQDFFSEAKAISLTGDERELSRFVIESHMMANSVSLPSIARLQERMAHGRQSPGSPDLSLDEKEKREIRQNIVSFMRGNPRFIPDAAEAQTFSLYRVFELAFPRFAMGLLLFVGAGAGITFASQASVPGDFLYPFKVNVYEPMVSKLATSDTSNAAWEARRAQNRLKEAAALAEQEDLTPETAQDLREQFEHHIANAQRGIDTLNAIGKEEVAVSISSELETYLQSNAAAVRAITGPSGGGGDPQLPAAAVTAKKPEQKGNSASARPRHSLMETVQTILSLPASSLSSKAASSETVSSAESSKGKKDEKSSVSSSAPVSSAARSSERAQASSEAKGETSFPAVDIDVDVSVPVSSLPSVLVPALFEDIMAATSSSPPLPHLLP